MKISIRPATEADAEQLLSIYAPYIKDTAITFEYDVPSVEEFRLRIAETVKKYPYLLAENAEGHILGYAYANTFKSRAAYDWSVETSIYVKMGEAGKGVGRLLHDSLETELKQMGILNMYACISCARDEDPYVTDNSIQFHAHLGFHTVGRFDQCGYKFNRWYDMVWMEKSIGVHTVPVKPVRFNSDFNHLKKIR
ncbi:MAG: N-acetyltransferase [Bacteroidales bacterium]|nr:N-acetyltransferase [Bacteroidales bacterium]